MRGSCLVNKSGTARADSKIVAFNTNGWMTTSLVNTPIKIADPSYPLYGLYVKEPNLTKLASTNTIIEPQDVNLGLFIFKATALIWALRFCRSCRIQQISLLWIACSISLQVVTAENWKFEIGHQVATWSGAIAGGRLGARVGTHCRRCSGWPDLGDSWGTRWRRDDAAWALVLRWILETFRC